MMYFDYHPISKELSIYSLILNFFLMRVCYTDPSPPFFTHHTAESEEDYHDLTEAVRLVKDVIAVVDSRVNEHEKRRRLKEFHSRTDSKSIMMMKSGQIFAREDLLRRRLIHDGMLQLKNSQGRLKGTEPPHDCPTYSFSINTSVLLTNVQKTTNFHLSFIQNEILLSSLFPRGPCSATIGCLCLPPRERSEICLRHAGRVTSLSFCLQMSLFTLSLPPSLRLLLPLFCSLLHQDLMSAAKYVVVIFSYPTVVVVVAVVSISLLFCS